MGTFPTAFRIAQAIGLTGAAWLSGNIACFTVGMPAVLQSCKESKLSTEETAKFWKALYDRGKARNPPIAAATASAFFYLAYGARPGTYLHRVARPNAAMLYGAAAILAIGIVPYTLIAMLPTNSALMARAKGEFTNASGSVDTEMEDLIQRWSSLNAGRSLFPLAAAALGIFATLF